MALKDMQIHDDDLIRTRILKELRSLQLRKSTDDTLKNRVISIGSMSKGSGYEIGVINRICSEMEEEGLIRWTRKPVIGDPTKSKRTFDITAEGRRLLDLKTQENPGASEVGYPGAFDSAYDAVGSDSIGIKHINSTGPLILVSASILDSIELYRESVRGNNKLKAEHESHHTEILEFLDRLRDAFQELIRSVPDSPDETIENIPEVKTWRKEFWEGLVGDLKNLSSPESARKIALPATLIFGCGAIGGMIGGPVGYGVGTYVGKVISGEAKASAIGEKIEKALSESTGEPKP